MDRTRDLFRILFGLCFILLVVTVGWALSTFLGTPSEIGILTVVVTIAGVAAVFGLSYAIGAVFIR